MPKWVRLWLIGFIVYFSVHWLGSLLLGLDRHGPYYSLLAVAFGAFAFGGVWAWLLTIGRKSKLQ